MATLTQAGRKQLQRVDDADGWLMLVQIDLPAPSGPVRVVNDTRDWLIGGITYIGLPFEVLLPQDVAGEASGAKLRMDNVGRDLVGVFESLPPGHELDITLRLVSRASPEVIEWEYVDGASVADATVPEISIGLGADERRNAVLLRYDPTTSPGNFAG